MVKNKFSNLNFSSAKLYLHLPKTWFPVSPCEPELLMSCSPYVFVRAVNGGASNGQRVSEFLGPLARQSAINHASFLGHPEQRVINSPAHLKSWPQLTEKRPNMKILLFCLFSVSFWALSHSAAYTETQHAYNRHENMRNKHKILQQQETAVS